MNKEDRKVFVGIFCKIYTDNFSEEMVNRLATGNEIYEFMMKDAGQCLDDSGNLIPGDCNLWYLGCNEKFGHLGLGYDLWSWNSGESSFDKVQAFVSMLFRKGLVSIQQHQTLMDKITEGRLIDNMYDIKDYLICKREGRPWIKRPGVENFRSDMKQRVFEMEKSFQQNGYRVFR
jgi:hypothetical protein